MGVRTLPLRDISCPHTVDGTAKQKYSQCAIVAAITHSDDESLFRRQEAALWRDDMDNHQAALWMDAKDVERGPKFD